MTVIISLLAIALFAGCLYLFTLPDPEYWENPLDNDEELGI